APGNLPALTRMLDCELAVVTEQGYFDELRASPVFRRLEEYCPVRLLMMDDLVVSPGRYGMALTFALHRGFADLNEAMTDHYLIFINRGFNPGGGLFWKGGAGGPRGRKLNPCAELLRHQEPRRPAAGAATRRRPPPPRRHPAREGGDDPAKPPLHHPR